MNIHPTAIVSKDAVIAEGVEIGPHSVIEEAVTIGKGTSIAAGVYIFKGTSIGSGCRIFNGAAIGGEPQDLAFNGCESYVKMGDRNIIREFVTIHRGTKENTSTAIGDDNYFMALSHVAHNCHIGNSIIMCNNSLLAGYVVVEDKAFISGACLVHQFVRIGTLALMAGGVRINRDLPPFMMADRDNVVSGYNIVGLRRSGLNPEARKQIKNAYSTIYRLGLNLSNALEEVEKTSPCAEVSYLIEFIRSSKRGICFARSNRNSDTAAVETRADQP